MSRPDWRIAFLSVDDGEEVEESIEVEDGIEQRQMMDSEGLRR